MTLRPWMLAPALFYAIAFFLAFTTIVIAQEGSTALAVLPLVFCVVFVTVGSLTCYGKGHDDGYEYSLKLQQWQDYYNHEAAAIRQFAETEKKERITP